MANQRMYITCVKCIADAKEGELKLSKVQLYVGKYYPDGGWHNNSDNLGEAFDDFMQKHKHGGLTGRYFVLMFDGWFDEMAKARDDIVARVQELACGEWGLK